jgi:hypothetical protein
MSSEPRLYSVYFADGIVEQLSLTPLASGTYRLEESPLLHDSINLGDVIAAQLIGDEAVRFVSILQKSSYSTLRWLISKSVVDSEGLSKFLDNVTAAGGLWERAIGGLLILHIPRSSAFNAESEFKLHTGS